MKRYRDTEQNVVMSEQELQDFYNEYITEYDNIDDFIFDSVRCGLLEVLENEDGLTWLSIQL